jgi:sarcosine oxidase, subunit gamma
MDSEFAPEARVTRETTPTLTILRVRGNPPAEIRALLGCALPRPTQTAVGGGVQVSWLAPGEWLIEGEIAGGRSALEDACAATHFHVAEVGGGWSAFAIRGCGAEDLLNTGCSLDLHMRAFPAGSCARTIFAGCGVFLRRAEEEEFIMMCDASLQDHLVTWFAEIRCRLTKEREATP